MLSWFSELPVLVNMSLTGAAVTLAVLAVRLLLKKAPKKIVCCLWLLVLFRFLCPVALQSDVSLMGAIGKNRQVQTITKTVQTVPEMAVSHDDQAETEPASDAGKVENASKYDLPAAKAERARAERDRTEPDVQIRKTAELSPFVWLYGVWAAGACSILGCSLASLLKLRRKLIGAVRLRENIFLADHVSSPFVVGIVRPKIYLPSSLPEQEQTYIILHEKTHIRRLDHVVKLLLFAALCIHWFNPFAWLAFVFAGQDMEMACDEAVLQKQGAQIRSEYSRSLLKLATGRRIFAGTPLAFGEGNTEGRIKRVLSWKKPALWLIVLAVLAVITAAVVLGTNPASFDASADGAYLAAEPMYEAPDYRVGEALQELTPREAAAQREDETPTQKEPEEDPERKAFYELFWELDQASFDVYLEKNPDVLANGWGGIHINEAGFEEEGIDACTIYGEQVLGLDAKNRVLLVRVTGPDWRGVLGIGKDPSLLNIEMADTFGVCGQSCGEIAENHGGILAMNANPFWDEDEFGNSGSGNGGIIAGYTRSNGVAYGTHFVDWSYKRLELREDNVMYLEDVSSDVSDDCTDCSEFMPAMIENGEKVPDSGFTGTHPRACIGQSARQEVLMLVIEGRQTRSAGTDVNSCTDVLLQHECVLAMNLDGGSSAMLWFDGKDCISSSSKPLRDLGGRPLPNAWVYHAAGWTPELGGFAAEGKE